MDPSAKQILLVEDEAIIAMVEIRQLRNAGYEVHHALSGEQAIETVRTAEYPPDLILMDIDLGSGMDGTQAATEILKTHQVPVVFLSSHVEKEVVEKTEGITSYGYIVKNSGEIVLLASVKMAFRLFEAHRRIVEQNFRMEASNEMLHETNEKLTASEQRFRSIVETAPEPIFVQVDRRFAYLNPAALELFGAETEAQLKGTPILDRIHPDFHQRATERIRRLNEQRVSVRDAFEQQWLRLDGRSVWVETVGEPTEYQGRRGALVFARNITARKQDTEQIAWWRQLFEYVVQHDMSAVAVFDTDMRHMYVSDQFLRAYRLSDRDLIGKCHYDVFPEIPASWKQVHQRALSGEVLSGEDDEFVHSDGSVEHVRWECRPWHEPDGSVGGIILYSEVITDRVVAADETRRNEQYLSTTLESIGEAVIATDSRGCVVRMNRIAERLTGWHRDASIGQPLSQVFRIIHPESRIPVSDPVAQVLESGATTGVGDHGVLVARDGTEYRVSDNAAPIRGADGVIQGVVLVFRDVGAEHTMRESLMRNQQLLAASQRIAQVGSWELDLRENRLTWSDEVYRIFGLKSGETSATYEAFLDAVHPDDRGLVDNAYSNSVRGNRNGYEVEHRIVQKNSGEVRHVLEKCVHERDASGAIIRSVGMVQDITDRKRFRSPRAVPV